MFFQEREDGKKRLKKRWIALVILGLLIYFVPSCSIRPEASRAETDDMLLEYADEDYLQLSAKNKRNNPWSRKITLDAMGEPALRLERRAPWVDYRLYRGGFTKRKVVGTFEGDTSVSWSGGSGTFARKANTIDDKTRIGDYELVLTSSEFKGEWTLKLTNDEGGGEITDPEGKIMWVWDEANTNPGARRDPLTYYLNPAKGMQGEFTADQMRYSMLLAARFILD